MEDNYNIKRNLGSPDPKRVAGYKDFDQLLAQYEHKPQPAAKTGVVRFFNFRLVAAAAAAVVVGIGCFFLWRNSTGVSVHNEADLFAALRAPQFQSSISNSDKGDTINCTSGTKLIVPAGAFVYADGNPVKKNVDIRYRELRDVVDVFAEQLPLVVNQHPVETAGAIEVRGFVDNQEVFISQGKSIEVELVSTLEPDNTTDNFNVYFLEPQSRSWEYRSPDQISVIGYNLRNEEYNPVKPMSTDAYVSLTTKDTASAAPVKGSTGQQPKEQLAVASPPVEPKRLNPDRFSFRLDIDPQEYPELANYKDMIWEVGPDNRFEKSWYDLEWSDITLSKGNDGRYVANLIYVGEDKRLDVELKVYPVVMEKDYNAAMASYRNNLAEYRSYLERIKTNPGQEPVIADAKADPAKVVIKRAQMRNQVVLNRFQIDRTGIWGCNRTVKELGEGAMLSPRILNNTGLALAADAKLYLFDGLHNAVQMSTPGESQMKISTRQAHVIWTILPDGRISVARFRTGQEASEVDKIYLSKPAKVVSAADLRKLIYG